MCEHGVQKLGEDKQKKKEGIREIPGGCRSTIPSGRGQTGATGKKLQLNTTQKEEEKKLGTRLPLVLLKRYQVASTPGGEGDRPRCRRQMKTKRIIGSRNGRGERRERKVGPPDNLKSGGRLGSDAGSWKERGKKKRNVKRLGVRVVKKSKGVKEKGVV